MPLIEDKEKPQKQEGLVKQNQASVISSSIRKRFQIRGPRIRVNWKPVKKSVKKVLHDMWKGSD